jgi:hypothetical protein
VSERKIRRKANLERDDKGGEGTIRIILRVHPNCRSSAGLSDGTVLVSRSRQPLLDAARVLIQQGYSPSARIEMWRPGASQYAMRGVLGVAARLTVDETRTTFAQWKPFSSSAVSSRIRSSEEDAATLAKGVANPPGRPPDEPDQPEKRRRPRTGNARALSFPDKAAAGVNYAQTLPTSSREEEPAALSKRKSALTR